MGIKEVLVVIVDPSSTAPIIAAAALAAAHGAQLTALHMQPERPIPLAALLQMPELEQILRQEDEAAQDKARQLAASLAEPFGVTPRWLDAIGVAEELLVHQAQNADIVVVGPFAAAEGSLRLAAQLVLHAGRPVLVVPEGADGTVVGRRVVIGWNGSRESTRAVHDALPILQKADWVEVLMISADPTRPAGDGWGSRICAHLAQHGVTAARRAVPPYPALGVDGTLLARCNEERADLIVMGAYGRSQLRDVILGGVTSGVLTKARIPVFISH